MRYLLFVASFFFLFSCAKQRMVNRLEGRWKYTKLLENSGSYVKHTEIYEFTGGDKENTDLPLVIYGQDTLYYEYQVPKKNVIRVQNLQTNSEIDWLVEDMDKNSLVVRVAEGVMFFEKE